MIKVINIPHLSNSDMDELDDEKKKNIVPNSIMILKDGIHCYGENGIYPDRGLVCKCL
jgi:hypothetical protein